LYRPPAELGALCRLTGRHTFLVGAIAEHDGLCGRYGKLHGRYAHQRRADCLSTAFASYANGDGNGNPTAATPADQYAAAPTDEHAGGNESAATHGDADGYTGAANANGYTGAANANGHTGAADADEHAGAADADEHAGAANADGHAGAATTDGYPGAPRTVTSSCSTRATYVDELTVSRWVDAGLAFAWQLEMDLPVL
jgi:hypothetical protein